MSGSARGAKLACHCGHHWRQRGDTPPKVCPKCKSPNWSRPARRTTPRECLRCGWVWESTGRRLPKICPHCKSEHWATSKASGLLSVRAADIRLPTGRRPKRPANWRQVSNNLQRQFIAEHGRYKTQPTEAELLADFRAWYTEKRKRHGSSHK